MVKLALVGFGRWGRRLFAALDGTSEKTSFATVVLRPDSVALGLVPRWKTQVVTDYRSMLDDPSIDGVVLATPPSGHKHEVLAAIQAGKHVYVEKPLALTLAEAEEIVAVSSKAKIILAVGFNRRFAPAFAEMKKRLDAGEIGDLLHLDANFSGLMTAPVRTSWRLSPMENPAGPMTPRGIHVLDAMIALGGPASVVWARLDKTGPVKDLATRAYAHLEFAGQVSGNLVSIQETSEFYRVQALGSKGILEQEGHFILHWRPLRRVSTTMRFDDIDLERAALEGFADAIRGEAGFPVTMAEVLNGVAVMERMARS